MCVRNLPRRGVRLRVPGCQGGPAGILPVRQRLQVRPNLRLQAVLSARPPVRRREIIMVTDQVGRTVSGCPTAALVAYNSLRSRARVWLVYRLFSDVRQPAACRRHRIARRASGVVTPAR